MTEYLEKIPAKQSNVDPWELRQLAASSFVFDYPYCFSDNRWSRI